MQKKLLLLGLLRRQEMHGYQLNEFIDNNLSLCTDLKKPTAYYLLDQMAKDGWISAEVVQEGNRPPRKVYRLTPAGESAFERFLLESLGNYGSVNFAGDVGLAFMDSLSSAEVLPLLVRQRQQVEDRLAMILAIPVHAGSLALIFSHQAHHLRSELVWLDDLIAALKAATDSN